MREYVTSRDTKVDSISEDDIIPSSVIPEEALLGGLLNRFAAPGEHSRCRQSYCTFRPSCQLNVKLVVTRWIS